MYFNFEENHPDTPRLGNTLTVLERVLITAVVYLLVVIVVLVVPKTEWYKAQVLAQEQERLEEIRQQQLKERENARFVFMAPKVDMKAPEPPKRAELSDIDRRAAAPERALKPANPLPFSRGNSPEKVEEAMGPRDRPEPAPSPPPSGEAEAARPTVPLPEAPNAAIVRPPESRPLQSRGSPTGILADAIKNVSKYGGGETFQNLQGEGGQQEPFIRFDSKGVDFGSWLRRFVAQVRRNWFIPYAAMTMKGHVVVTFNIHKDGRITDLQVLKPSSVDAFTNSAFNAIATSNPTIALPPEYPDSKAFFTVTFYFNESPDR
jgi:TonB family protein